MGVGLCRIWEVKSGRLVREFQAQSGHILAPDSCLLAVAQPKKAVRLWEMQSGMMTKELPTRGTSQALGFYRTANAKPLPGLIAGRTADPAAGCTWGS